MNHLLGFFGISIITIDCINISININWRQEFGEGGHELSRVSVIIMVCARAAPKEGVLLALSC